MKLLSAFSLRGEMTAPERARAVLLHDGRETGLAFQAVQLEAQFGVPPDLSLLFLTDNSPYEEQLQIVLLDSRFQILDGLTLGQDYTPGVLTHLEPQSDMQLRFEFFGNTQLLLSIHPAGALLPVRTLPSFAKPLKGRFFSRQYMSLQKA
ncbi:hypothetical protein HRD49_35315 [Corallococcus exiguus]|uniref:hypothetical protein n=1 Tax=Corallococcus TaxID=83461 RepID=UPI000F8969AE|nr:MULTISPECIES: hypothetical protein [Corallococcus]NNC20208.1 hypothetical protein [Corallococcus exiguus]NRD67031.1 hypothetical protein [Corallococcus exiguus]